MSGTNLHLSLGMEGLAGSSTQEPLIGVHAIDGAFSDCANTRPSSSEWILRRFFKLCQDFFFKNRCLSGIGISAPSLVFLCHESQRRPRRPSAAVSPQATLMVRSLRTLTDECCGVYSAAMQERCARKDTSNKPRIMFFAVLPWRCTSDPWHRRRSGAIYLRPGTF